MTPQPPTLNVDPYRGEWVALDPQTYTVLGHHQELEEAERQAQVRGVTKPLLLPVAEDGLIFPNTPHSELEWLRQENEVLKILVGELVLRQQLKKRTWISP